MLSRIRQVQLIEWIAAVVSVFGVVVAAEWPLLATDTACRYAPMAEAFAVGEWTEAFHPRFGVGAQILSGLLVWATGLDGYTACAVTSTLAWALCLVPLFHLADSAFDRRTAWIAVILFLSCPQPLIWGLKGLREPFKMLGIVMAADCLVSAIKGQNRVIAKGCSAVSLLVLFKVDAILLALILVVSLLIVDRVGRKSLIVSVFSLIALQPMCALVYYWHGWWLPAPQYLNIIVRFIPSLGQGAIL